MKSKRCWFRNKRTCCYRAWSHGQYCLLSLYWFGLGSPPIVFQRKAHFHALRWTDSFRLQSFGPWLLTLSGEKPPNKQSNTKKWQKSSKITIQSTLMVPLTVRPWSCSSFTSSMISVLSKNQSSTSRTKTHNKERNWSWEEKDPKNGGKMKSGTRVIRRCCKSMSNKTVI